jgi:hypothetical protein
MPATTRSCLARMRPRPTRCASTVDSVVRSPGPRSSSIAAATRVRRFTRPPAATSPPTTRPGRCFAARSLSRNSATISGFALSVNSGLPSRRSRPSTSFDTFATSFVSRASSAARSTTPSSGMTSLCPATTPVAANVGSSADRTTLHFAASHTARACSATRPYSESSATWTSSGTLGAIDISPRIRRISVSTSWSSATSASTPSSVGYSCATGYGAAATKPRVPGRRDQISSVRNGMMGCNSRTMTPIISNKRVFDRVLLARRSPPIVHRRLRQLDVPVAELVPDERVDLARRLVELVAVERRPNAVIAAPARGTDPTFVRPELHGRLGIVALADQEAVPQRLPDLGREPAVALRPASRPRARRGPARRTPPA